jgi:hypothetical protein
MKRIQVKVKARTTRSAPPIDLRTPSGRQLPY